MRQLFVTLVFSLGVLACERKEPNKPFLEESRKINTPIKVGFPTFESWAKVSYGISENEVIEILGKPKSGTSWDDYKKFRAAENAEYHWNYGSLYPESASHPFESDFSVVFSKGLVTRLIDPFGGAAISPSGIPAVPRLFVPEDNAVFNYFPRIIDLRWWASSGSMPITYEVSIEVKYPSGKWGIESDLQKSADSLHIAMDFPGANEGRWRVRGRNQEGVGEWSEYRNFKFTR